MSNINIDIENSDREYRDAMLKAYICGVLDVPIEEFEDVVKERNKKMDKIPFIRVMKEDLEVRLTRLIQENN